MEYEGLGMMVGLAFREVLAFALLKPKSCNTIEMVQDYRGFDRWIGMYLRRWNDLIIYIV